MQTNTNKAANEKVDRAIAHINKAYAFLGAACAELCSIEGAYEQWKKVGDKMDEIKDLSRSISYTIPRNRIDLDYDAKRSYLKDAPWEK